jgi:hypothetical protein
MFRSRTRIVVGLMGCLAITSFLMSGTAGAQDAAAAEEDKKKVLIVGKWYPGLEAGVNLTQSSYSDNWAGGDKGSVVWTAIANGNLENQLRKSVNWLQTLKLAYGQTHQQQVSATGARIWERPEKSTDLVDYETIFRFTLGGWVDPFVAGRLESQFEDASDPAGRRLTFNPLTFRESAGVAREFYKEEDRTLLSRLGFTFRQSSRKLFTEPAPIKTTQTEATNDGGFEWVTDSKMRVLEKRVTWTSKLAVYQPVFYSGKEDLEGLSDAAFDGTGIDTDIEDFTTEVSLDFENIFSTQITKIISVSLYTRWVYDKYDNSVKPLLDADGNLTNPGDVKGAIRKAGQFKQTLAIGLVYRFV